MYIFSKLMEFLNQCILNLKFFHLFRCDYYYILNGCRAVYACTGCTGDCFVSGGFLAHVLCWPVLLYTHTVIVTVKVYLLLILVTVTCIKYCSYDPYPGSYIR